MYFLNRGGFGSAGEEINETTITIPVPDEVPASDAKNVIAWVAVDEDVEVTEETTPDEMTRELVEAVDAKKLQAMMPKKMTMMKGQSLLSPPKKLKPPYR